MNITGKVLHDPSGSNLLGSRSENATLAVVYPEIEIGFLEFQKS